MARLDMIWVVPVNFSASYAALCAIAIIPPHFTKFMPHCRIITSLTLSEDCPMQTIKSSYRGLSLLMDINWDRGLYAATICFALAAGAFIGSL
jgi:hypothetical protein